MTMRGRIERVAEYIREEVAKLLIDGIKDPRLGFVSVMKVKMSKDLRYADIYVSLYGNEKQRKSSLIALQNSAGWIKAMIAQNLHMRYIPEIRFFPDDSLDRVYEMEEVFQHIREEKKHQPFLALSLEAIIDEIRNSQRILITTHERPDGDAIGSLLGMWFWLESQGKSEIIPLISESIPEMYAFLPRAKSILTLEDEELPRIDVDTVIILDVASLSRIGDVAKEIRSTHKVIVIDHHDTLEAQGLMGFVDSSYSACGEIVAELFIKTEVPFTPESAMCLYVAQATDTGGYMFSNTTARTHRLAGMFLETGIDIEDIHTRVFNTITMPQFEIMKRILNRVKFDMEGKIAYSYLTQKDFKDSKATLKDCHNLVNILRNIEGVVAGVLFTEMEDGRTKISIRSRKIFHAGNFLREFGGGGHQCAGGGIVEQPLNEAMSIVLERLNQALTQ